MKKFLAICILIFYCFSTYVSAQDVLSPKTQEILNNSIVLKIGSNVGFVNNEKKNMDENSSIVPIIKNGRTLLPIRFISENLGSTVSWDQSTSTATIQKDDKIIKLTLSKNIMLVNNQEITIESSPEVVNGRVFIPLRSLAEVLNQKIYWHNKGIIILSLNEISFKEDARKELESQMNQSTQTNDNINTKPDVDLENDENKDEADQTDINNEEPQTIHIDEKLIDQKAKYIEEQVINEINSLFPQIVVVDPPKPNPQPGQRNLDTLVKPGYVIATITKNTPYYSSYNSKKPIGEFGKGAVVEVIRDKDMTKDKNGHWYQIKSVGNGTVGWILKGSLKIPPDPKTNPEKMTQAEIELYANTKGFSSNTKYFMWVDIDRQLVYVLMGKKGEWKLAKTMTCATGKNVSPTIRGTFTIQGRGSWMDTAPKGDNVGVMNWVQFYEDYLFHSVIVDNKGKVRDGTQERRVSHGCIRLSMNDSKWVYDYIPKGTTVFTN